MTDHDQPIIPQEPANYQTQVSYWLHACFGKLIATDKTERNHRFIEEALELVQAAGTTQSECMQLVDYVYSRPVGALRQECGGVMVTLAALCYAHGISMTECGEVELARIWTKVEAIRAKQATKPKHSPLPQVQPTSPDKSLDTLVDAICRIKPEEIFWKKLVRYSVDVFFNARLKGLQDTHDTALTALDYNRKERDDLKRENAELRARLELNRDAFIMLDHGKKLSELMQQIEESGNQNEKPNLEVTSS